MSKILILIPIIFSLLSCNEKTLPSVNAQSGPFIGYDNIPWGTSPENVRKAYNLGEEFKLLADNNDQNIGWLIIEYSSGNIYRREFAFNKWNDNKYKLFTVWVRYCEEENSQNIFNSLHNTLQGIYGPVTNVYEDPRRTTARTFLGMSGVMTEIITYVIYGTFAPDIEVTLINKCHI